MALCLKEEDGFKSYQVEIFRPSSVSASKKLSSAVASNHAASPEIEGTAEFFVKERALVNLNLLTKRLDCVTPAIIMPIIKSTIDNSINEKAFFYALVLKRKFSQVFLIIDFIFSSYKEENQAHEEIL